MSREKVVFQAESVQTVTEDIEDNISETAQENSQTENGVYVKGMALPFGKTSRNGVQYEKESVKENAQDLIGRPILFNHKQDFSTGHILNIEITEDGMYYEGDINPNAEMPNGVPVAEAVERGDIRSPSIQAFIEQTGEEADEEAVIDEMPTEKVEVADFIEISMVTVPGFPQATAMPEHLQKQGVKPMSEALGVENVNKEQAEYSYEVGDWVSWSFAEGRSQGQITDRENEPGEALSASGNEREATEEEPVYKMDEWDEEEQELTNDVVKSESELTEIDDPTTESENVRKEQYEFAPVPTHVLYESEEDAMLRAENLGLDDTHEHEMSGQIYYMAGDTHEEWLEAIERENPTDRNSAEQEDGKRGEPFAGYDDFEDCVKQNSDKDDAEAYCSVIKRKTEESKKLKQKKEALADVDLTPPEEVKNAAQAALDFEEENQDREDCGTGVGDSRANSITNETLEPEDFLGGENTAIPDYLESHQEDVTAEGTPTDWSDEEMNDCGNRQYAKWGGTGTGTGLEWAKEKEQELMDAKESVNNISEDDNMSEEQEQQKESKSMEELKSEEFEQVGAEDLYELIAGMHPEVEASDVGELLGDFDYDFNVNALVDMVAKVVDEETNTVMDKMADLAEGQMPDEDEEEYGDKDMDDEEEESTESEGNVEEMEREELEEKVNNLEERLEAILDNEEGRSKQNTPNTEEEDLDLNRRPTFKDTLK